MQNEDIQNDTQKKDWKRPELIEYGSVEDITLAPKGWGSDDGMGLEPGAAHPSL